MGYRSEPALQSAAGMTFAAAAKPNAKGKAPAQPLALEVQNQHKRKEKTISLDIPNAPSPVAKRTSRYATRR